MSLFLNHFTFNSTDKQDGSGLSRIGATGIFTGLIIGTLAVQIYRICVKRGWSIKMPNSVPKGVSDSFTSLIPGFMIAFVVLIICNTDIFNLLYVPFSFVSGLVDTWWGVLIIVFLIHGLWFFGIHGATIITSFTSAFVLANMASNVSGGFHVYAGEFNNAFTTIGGSGATLGAVLYMAFMSKSHQMRELGKVAVVPAFSTSTNLCSSVCRSSTILIWSFHSFWHQWQAPWSATLQSQRTSFQKSLPNNHGRHRLV